jgi:uncharacterized protein YndB with AHSA1/START domain
MTSDRIEKKIMLRAPVVRVWRAIADAEEFGAWFGVRLHKPFTPGARVDGQLLATGYENVKLELTVERVVPERLLSFRWHPFAVNPRIDYSVEPTTLVEFHLEETAGGTVLTLVESGFERIPISRRAEAFKMNAQGWAAQMENIERYLTR